MNILLLNAGSGSLKCTLIDSANSIVLALLGQNPETEEFLTFSREKGHGHDDQAEGNPSDGNGP
jgi:hypothetical protein